ncbi:MAG: ABC transporter ATP-binding protein/permease [Vallitalea sp.]|jgi:ATP-binding cassette subfamily B protein|nr:ABC transporter ATP-binding protein/permease [Vallitalea sp.]
MISNILGYTTKKGKGMLIVSIIFFTLKSLLNAAMTIVILNMIQNIVSREMNDLLKYWLLLIAIIILKGIFNTIADLAKHLSGFEIAAKIREKVVVRLKQFSLGFYNKERLGEISTIIHKDVDNIEMITAHMWSRMFSDIIVAFIIGGTLFSINWKMGLAMVSFIPLGILLLIFGIKSTTKVEKETQDDLAEMVSLFVEYTKGITLLKAFNKSETFENKLKSSTVKFGESSKKLSKSVAKYLGEYFVFLEISFAIMAIVGAIMVFYNQLTIPNYIIFIIFSKEFYNPFNNIESYWLNYIKVKDSYGRVMGVLNTPIIETTSNPVKISKLDIEFNNVDFSYEEDEFQMKDINLGIEEGSMVALVGPSGSGKTTITNLILRFYEPQRGTINIGGVDIKDIDYDDLLSNISIVMQNVVLFSDTIYDNIKVGNNTATKEEVIKAAKKAMIHDFIMSLPEGYDTKLGENGVGLSGGQKQRLSIARAFLKDSPIVILDEMTSNVDPINERKIQKAISKLAKNRTVIVVAHHLKSIKNADKIVVFEKGKIVEVGNHNDLLEKSGLYKELWDAQKNAHICHLSA